jgi:hypothetical protein
MARLKEPPQVDRERCEYLYVTLLEVSRLIRAGERTDAVIVAERALAAECAQQNAEFAALEPQLEPDDDGGNVYEHIADDEARTGLDAFSDCQLGGLPS